MNSNLKDNMWQLIQLQDCDNRIREIIDKKNEGPLRIQRLEDELNTNEMNITNWKCLKKIDVRLSRISRI